MQGKSSCVTGEPSVTCLFIVRVGGLKQEQRNRKLRKQEAEGIRIHNTTTYSTVCTYIETLAHSRYVYILIYCNLHCISMYMHIDIEQLLTIGTVYVRMYTYFRYV